MKKRILYLTRANLSLRRAHSHNILRTADALGKNPDIELCLLSLTPLKRSRDEVFLEHNILKPSFLFLHQKSALLYLLKNKNKFDVIYSREHALWPVFIFSKLLGMKVFFEMHRFPRSVLEKFIWGIIYRVSSGLIVITEAIKKRLLENSLPVVVIHCTAAEPELFNYTVSKKEARRTLGFPVHKFLLLSLGTTGLYDFRSLFKGVSLLPPEVNLVLVGLGEGEKTKIESNLKEKGIYERTKVIPRVPYKDIPLYLRAADVLLVPEGEDTPGFAPTKVYWYLAAERPIVSYKNEAISEVLKDGMNAILLKDPSPENWKAAIERIKDNPALAEVLSRATLGDASRFSWPERGKSILKFILDNI